MVQMIDVMKRLAELDKDNSRVINPMVKEEKWEDDSLMGPADRFSKNQRQDKSAFKRSELNQELGHEKDNNWYAIKIYDPIKKNWDYPPVGSYEHKGMQNTINSIQFLKQTYHNKIFGIEMPDGSIQKYDEGQQESSASAGDYGATADSQSPISGNNLDKPFTHNGIGGRDDTKEGINMKELDVNSIRYLAGLQETLNECGMLPGMGMSSSKVPASISVTADSGPELSTMLKDIMSLAGVHKVEPQHMPIENPDAGPSTVISAPPMQSGAESDMKNLIDIVDSGEGEGDGEDQDGSEEENPADNDLDNDGETVEKEVDEDSMNVINPNLPAVDDQEMYNNSPREKPLPDGVPRLGDANTGDHRKRQSNLPTGQPVKETTVQKLFAEYKEFVSEAKKCSCKKNKKTCMVHGKKKGKIKEDFFNPEDEGALDEVSRWTNGCGKIISVFVPKGYSSKEIKVQCGSTSYDGGVNQCEQCAQKYGQPKKHEYGDIEHMDDHDYDHDFDESINQKKKIKEGEDDIIFIACEPHGIPGVAVETTKHDVEALMNAIKEEIRRGSINKDMIKQMHLNLVKELKAMLPAIMRGESPTDSNGEVYTKQIFDDDLIHMAIYDHLANGKRIHLMMSPSSSKRLQ